MICPLILLEKHTSIRYALWGGVILRICHHCQSEMLEGFDVKVEGGGYGIKISKGTGRFAKRLEKPKVAVCPQCGEISLYLENLEDLR